MDNKPKKPEDYKDYELSEKLPEDYVDAAEKVILKLGKWNPYKKKYDFSITSTKIRRFYSPITDILNDERSNTKDTLFEKSRQKLMLTRMRFAYEAGRDQKVNGEFINETKLMKYIKDIENSRDGFIRFAHYMEALVAWHRYYGGKD